MVLRPRLSLVTTRFPLRQSGRFLGPLTREGLTQRDRVVEATLGDGLERIFSLLDLTQLDWQRGLSQNRIEELDESLRH